MKSNYKRLGDYIEEVDIRNQQGQALELWGVSIDKKFIKSVANIIGTDLSKYKIVSKNCFVCSLMQVSRDEKIPVARWDNETDAIVSPAYKVFKIKDEKSVLPKYVDLWFKRAEFDREASYYGVGGVRGSLEWGDFCDMKLPIPSIEEQQKIVDAYETIEKRIAIKKKIIDNLTEIANLMFVQNYILSPSMEEWKTDTFSSLIEQIIGGDWGQEKHDGNYSKKVCCIRGTDVPELNYGIISSAPVRYILEKNFSAKHICQNDMVIEISGGSPVQSTGRIAMVSKSVLHYNQDMICSNFCRVLRVDEDYVFFFLQYWLYLYNNGVMFNYENSSTGLKNFDLTAFIKEYQIKVPPRNIAKKFNDIMRKVYQEIHNIGFEIECLKRIQVLILPRLMSLGVKKF